MNESMSAEELTAWKAQQEANREARLRQLYSPAELWQRQQRSLEELARLVSQRKKQTAVKEQGN